MLLFLSIIIVALYCFLISCLVIGNLKSSPRFKSSNSLTPVSILVPFRNEAKNLPRIIEGLIQQDYAVRCVEIILINDHSEDESFSIAINYSDKYDHIKLINLEGEQGKKAALEKGVLHSSGELILTVDADCSVQPQWLSSVVKHYKNTGASLLVGPVQLKSSQSLLSPLLELEFAVNIACTSGAIRIDRPLIANGANLAFKKELFSELNPYEDNHQLASGDDVFLLHKAKKAKKKIVFIADENAMVTTYEHFNWPIFVMQRLRWASKSKAYKDRDTLLFGGVVLLMNGLLIILFFYSFFNDWLLLGMVFILKWCVDFLLVWSARQWIQLKNSLLLVFILSIIYPFYSISFAALSFMIKPKWKGRKTFNKL